MFRPNEQYVCDNNLCIVWHIKHTRTTPATPHARSIEPPMFKLNGAELKGIAAAATAAELG